MGSISENCLGWATRDTFGVLLPYNFIRRDTGLNHALLTITHCGICYADVAWAKNIPRNAKYPVVPGHDIIGIVKEVRSNVRRFKVGDHVGVEPYVNSCKACEHCKIQEVHCDVETTQTFNFVDHVYAPMIRHKVNKPGKSLGVVGSGGLGHLVVKFGKAFGLHVTVFCASNSKKNEALNLLGADKFIISSNMQQMEVEECKFIIEAKTIQRMELLVLSTLKWRMRVVTPFTFMDYFFRKNNDDLPPPRSQISRLVELILTLTRGIEYLEFKPSEVAAVVSISIIRETNLNKSTIDHVSHEDESKTSKDSVESSENDV
ncbi:hypothetical protein GIB67_037130 [Kingdonia uniflora]|uniref:Alcohol dehydrogenase-like N-terminal domain-containing protein n=1 Tax=Kingdonia uniflora TaxID=39325 RepID=A0A7J7LHZ7_9MAGN|nr:hypothetical protein GIB67_037130 [Kingdonia uniflora]